MKNYVFIGDCVNGLNDPDFQNRVADDATEMSNVVDESNTRNLTIQEFLNLAILDTEIETEIVINPQRWAFFINDDREILVRYDLDEDVHHFYVI